MSGTAVAPCRSTYSITARIGAVITMVNPLLPAEDYKYYLDYTRARVA